MDHPTPLAALSPSRSFAVTVDERAIAALDAGKADFSSWETDGASDVRVELPRVYSATDILLSPRRKGVPVEVSGNTAHFRLEPGNYCLAVPGQKPLFLYADLPETNRPAPDSPGIRYFAAGPVHSVGRLELRSGETLFIERGAVVRGTIHCRNAEDVRIRGRGILDATGTTAPVRSIVFENCRNVTVEGITMVHPAHWMLVFARCENVAVRHIRQIGSCMSSDGIDICGSRDVLVEDCCLRNDDDNIAIKSLITPQGDDWRGNVKNVRIRRCILLNGEPGNAMEIGYELSADRVEDIVFEDIDVIQANGGGAVFSIHNGDRARVENIIWRNIRVEHYWDKLVDLRVVVSRYNNDPIRGSIRNIKFTDIHVSQSPYNPGCSLSLIGGFSPSHPVENVRFERLFLSGTAVSHPDQIDLHTRNATAIHFA